MKQEEFFNKIKKLDLGYSHLGRSDNESVEIPIYFGEENGEVKFLDVEGMREEFEEKLNRIKEMIKNA